METINRRKPTLIIGGQGVGKTTKARELAGVKPGQEADKFGIITGISPYGTGMGRFEEFGIFKIFEEVYELSVLMIVIKSALESKDKKYIIVSQTGAFPLPEGIEDYVELIDLGSLQDKPAAL